MQQYSCPPRNAAGGLGGGRRVLHDFRKMVLLEQLKSCCKQRTDGDWALLLAAGDDLCVQQVYNILASYISMVLKLTHVATAKTFRNLFL